MALVVKEKTATLQLMLISFWKPCEELVPTEINEKMKYCNYEELSDTIRFPVT
jgi:hypothetical protein